MPTKKVPLKYFLQIPGVLLFLLGGEGGGRSGRHVD